MKQITLNNINYYLLNKNTKKAKHYLELYDNSKTYTLWDCYQKVGFEKNKIYYKWHKEYKRIENDTNINYLGNFKIISYSHWLISLGWQINDKVYIITPSKNYIINLGE